MHRKNWYIYRDTGKATSGHYSRGTLIYLMEENGMAVTPILTTSFLVLTSSEWERRSV